MIAIFDLDETLIHGDCTTLWGEWLCKEGLVTDIPAFIETNERLMDAYRAQTLNQQDCIDLYLAPVKHLTTIEIDALVRRFIIEEIQPIVFQEGLTKIQNYQNKGKEVIIISASPLFLVTPIAELCFNLKTAFGIDVKVENDRYTGEIVGVIPYQDGKITTSEKYLTEKLRASGIEVNAQVLHEALSECSFYSDSINDLPLLSKVRYPYTVNPDITLYNVASAKEWPIFRFARIGNFSQAS